MSTRVDQLRFELSKLYEISSGDDGIVMTRATKKDHSEVLRGMEEMPLEPLLTELAVVMAGAASAVVLQKGKRPADYWQDSELVDALVKRCAKALSSPSKEFLAAFQAVLRGQG